MNCFSMGQVQQQGVDCSRNPWNTPSAVGLQSLRAKHKRPAMVANRISTPTHHYIDPSTSTPTGGDFLRGKFMEKVWIAADLSRSQCGPMVEECAIHSAEAPNGAATCG